MKLMKPEGKINISRGSDGQPLDCSYVGWGTFVESQLLYCTHLCSTITTHANDQKSMISQHHFQLRCNSTWAILMNNTLICPQRCTSYTRRRMSCCQSSQASPCSDMASDASGCCASCLWSQANWSSLLEYNWKDDSSWSGDVLCSVLEVRPWPYWPVNSSRDIFSRSRLVVNWGYLLNFHRNSKLALGLAGFMMLATMGTVANSFITPRLAYLSGVVVSTWLITITCILASSICFVKILGMDFKSSESHKPSKVNVLAVLKRMPPQYWQLCIMAVLTAGCISPFNNTAQEFMAETFYGGDETVAGSVVGWDYFWIVG